MSERNRMEQIIGDSDRLSLLSVSVRHQAHSSTLRPIGLAWPAWRGLRRNRALVYELPALAACSDLRSSKRLLGLRRRP